MSANEKNGMLLSYKSKKYRVIAQNMNHLKVHTYVYEAFY